VLRQIINKDPLESVDPRYKAELPKELQDALIAAKPHIPEVLIEVLGTFAESTLTETFLADSSPMMDVLDPVMEGSDLTRADMNAVSENLPAGLLMKHWGAVYNLLKQS